MFVSCFDRLGAFVFIDVIGLFLYLVQAELRTPTSRAILRALEEMLDNFVLASLLLFSSKLSKIAIGCVVLNSILKHRETYPSFNFHAQFGYKLRLIRLRLNYFIYFISESL